MTGTEFHRINSDNVKYFHQYIGKRVAVNDLGTITCNTKFKNATLIAIRGPDSAGYTLELETDDSF